MLRLYQASIELNLVGKQDAAFGGDILVIHGIEYVHDSHTTPSLV